MATQTIINFFIPWKKRILLPAVSALKHQNTENKIPRNVVGFVCIVDESDNLPLSTKWVKWYLFLFLDEIIFLRKYFPDFFKLAIIINHKNLPSSRSLRAADSSNIIFPLKRTLVVFCRRGCFFGGWPFFAFFEWSLSSCLS